MNAMKVEEVSPLCSDCGCAVAWQGAEAIARGSTVREPGEPLCGSCSAVRTKLVRELDKIPSTLDQIQAKRMVKGPRKGKR